jgi:hypothetical protein
MLAVLHYCAGWAQTVNAEPHLAAPHVCTCCVQCSALHAAARCCRCRCNAEPVQDDIGCVLALASSPAAQWDS